MKILLISYYFAPGNAIAAVRTTKIAKYLIKLGYDLEVVCGPSFFIDPIWRNDLKAIKKVHVVHGLRAYEEIVKKMNSKLSSFNQKETNVHKQNIKIIFSKLLLNPFSIYLDLVNSYFWFHKAKVRIEKKLQNYDIIISSYGPICSHLLGLYLKKKNKNIFWIADYRDPMIQDSQKGLVKLYNILYQHIILKTSDVSLCVSEGLKKHLSRLEPKANIYVVTNGFDPEDALFCKTDNIFNDELIFSYCGTLYFGRSDLSVLFAMLKELIDERRIDRKSIVILYAGPDFAILEKMAKKFNLESLLRNYNKVSRDISINITNNSDIALLASWNTRTTQGVITGKVYELFLLKKIVFTFISGEVANSELKGIVEKAKAGIVYEEADKQSYSIMKEQLALLYQKKVSGYKLEQQYNNEYISRYTYNNIAINIDNIIRNAKCEKRDF